MSKAFSWNIQQTARNKRLDWMKTKGVLLGCITRCRVSLKAAVANRGSRATGGP